MVIDKLYKPSTFLGFVSDTNTWCCQGVAKIAQCIKSEYSYQARTIVDKHSNKTRVNLKDYRANKEFKAK